jgi:hypothetical protein
VSGYVLAAGGGFVDTGGMTAERKRLMWILILIAMFFANLILVAIFIFR